MLKKHLKNALWIDAVCARKRTLKASQHPWPKSKYAYTLHYDASGINLYIF